MKAHFYTNLVEGGCTIQGDVIIQESTLNEIVLSTINRFKLVVIENQQNNYVETSFKQCFTKIRDYHVSLSLKDTIFEHL